MARGWESKSIEAQQEEAGRSKPSEKSRLTREEANLVRALSDLRLSLTRVMEQLAASQNPSHSKMLQLAKSDLEERISKLDRRWSAGQTTSSDSAF